MIALFVWTLTGVSKRADNGDAVEVVVRYVVHFHLVSPCSSGLQALFSGYAYIAHFCRCVMNIVLIMILISFFKFLLYDNEFYSFFGFMLGDLLIPKNVLRGMEY